MVLPADCQPTKMMEPREKPFDSPTSAIAAQTATILGGLPAHSAMRGDHLNAVTFGQSTIQTVAVVAFVADQSRRESVEEAVPEDPLDELAFVRRSAFDTNSERKTVIIGESKGASSLGLNASIRSGTGRPAASAVFWFTNITFLRLGKMARKGYKVLPARFFSD